MWVMWVTPTQVQIRLASCGLLAPGFYVGDAVGGLGVIVWVMCFSAWWVMWVTPTRHTHYTVLTVAYTTIVS